MATLIRIKGKPTVEQYERPSAEKKPEYELPAPAVLDSYLRNHAETRKRAKAERAAQLPPCERIRRNHQSQKAKAATFAQVAVALGEIARKPAKQALSYKLTAEQQVEALVKLGRERGPEWLAIEIETLEGKLARLRQALESL